MLCLFCGRFVFFVGSVECPLFVCSFSGFCGMLEVFWRCVVEWHHFKGLYDKPTKFLKEKVSVRFYWQCRVNFAALTVVVHAEPFSDFVVESHIFRVSTISSSYIVRVGDGLCAQACNWVDTNKSDIRPSLSLSLFDELIGDIPLECKYLLRSIDDSCNTVTIL